MLNLGRGMSPANIIDKSFKIFDFKTAMPAEFSIVRADSTSCATYRNAVGKLTAALANTPRIDYTTSGKALGILIENTRQNKLALYNASPFAITGLSVISGSAALSVMNDVVLLALAGLDQIGNGNVVRINNSAQVTSSAVAFATTFGNTNAHSFSIWARIATAHTPVITRSGTSPQSLSMSGNSYVRYKLENITGHAAADKIQFTIPAGCEVYFILHQLEEATFCSSEIITAGAAATRQGDRVRALNLSTASWFKTAQGYMAIRYRPYVLGLDTTDQYLAYASDGTTNNSIGMRIAKGVDKDIILNIRTGGTATFPASTDILHVPNAVYSTAMAWRSDKMIAQMGGVAKSGTPAVAMPSGLTELAIGARNGINETLWGWIEFLEVGIAYKEMGDLSSRMYKPGDSLVIGGGQSLIGGYFYSQETSSSTGRDRFNQIMSTKSVDRNNLLADASTGSSAASKTSDPAETNFWWALNTNSRGPAFDTFYAKIKSAGFTPNVVMWAQGEVDSNYIGVTTTRSQYKQALQAIFSDMRATLGNAKMLIQRHGRRGTGSYANASNAGMQTIREVQKELAAENPEWIILGAESYDQALYDNLHMVDAGYYITAERNANALLGVSGSNGPTIVLAIRSGTTVTVTINHDAGNNITPALGISGFDFKAGGSSITLNAAVRTNATTITLTLASTPSVLPEVLYYGYDGMLGIDIANVVKDNAVPQMPLRTGKVTL